jgi:hypothetical protein
MSIQNDGLRQAALELESLGFVEFEHKSQRYGIKPPTLLQQKQAKLAAKTKDGTDETLMGVLLLIGCIVDPATGETVFTRNDIDMLMNQPSTPNSFLGKALKAFGQLSEQQEKVEGFFGATGSAS